MSDKECNHTSNPCFNDIPELNDENTANMARVFHLLGDKNRLRIVLSCINGEKSVSEIIDSTDLSQSLISHNLRSLKDYRILKSRKDGKFNYYSLDDEHIRHIITDLAHHILEK